jgi:hypothetical protein
MRLSEGWEWRHAVEDEIWRRTSAFATLVICGHPRRRRERDAL